MSLKPDHPSNLRLPKDPAEMVSLHFPAAQGSLKIDKFYYFSIYSLTQINTISTSMFSMSMF